MEFELAEEQKRFQKLAHEYFEKELAPIVVELEKKNNFPLDFFKKIGETFQRNACKPCDLLLDGFEKNNLFSQLGGNLPSLQINGMFPSFFF